MPLKLESWDCLRQLRDAGMMETIRIRREGFSLRETHADFLRQYRILYPPATNCKDLLLNLSRMLSFKKKQCQIGRTKVFIHEDLRRVLNNWLREKTSGSAVLLQRIWRGFSARKCMLMKKKAILCIQRELKKWMCMKRYFVFRKAIVVIQANHKRRLEQK